MDFLTQARRQMLAGQMQEAREQLLASYAGLSDAEMQEPGACGEWSVAEALAYIAAWDRASIETFRAMLAGERPPFLDMDEEGLEQFTEEQYAANKDIEPDKAVSEMVSAREELLDLLRGLDNEAMFAPAPGDDNTDLSIASCLQITISNDEEYAAMIEEWRANRET